MRAERVYLSTDCGLKALPRFVALEKLKALVRAANRVRAELPAPRVAARHGRELRPMAAREVPPALKGRRDVSAGPSGPQGSGVAVEFVPRSANICS